jgi:predicted metal-dependent phosphoesterase TrpH
MHYYHANVASLLKDFFQMSDFVFGRADLHIHTTASDGVASVLDVLNFVAEQRALNVIAITDHDTLDASLWAYERQHLYKFDIIPGVEVSSRDGHILALWVTNPIKANMSIADTVAAIHEQKGLAVLAHPFHPYIKKHSKQAMRHFRKPKGLLEAGFDALEIHNSGIAGTGSNWIAKKVAKKLGMAVTAGSDAHTLGAIGTAETIFTGSSAEDLRQALITKSTVAKGRAWSITDYVSYLKHEKQRKAMTSSENIESFPLINP